MVENKIRLKVLTYVGSTFTDISKECADFSRDTAAVTLADTSILYVGFNKPFNQIYVNLDTANTNATTLSIQYWDGSQWTSATNGVDDTKGLTRSGFITWDRNLTNESQTSINSSTKNWIKITSSVTTSAMVVSGLNFIFVDDQDLKTEVPEIADSNHLAGKTSHILTHVAVRNQIIQDLRNKDYFRINPTTGLKEDLTPWDILDANQLKQAAIFLALSKIYFNFSDETDDKYQKKSEYYYSKYDKAINMSRISLDLDDDGLEDEEEKNVEFKIFRITR